MFFSFVSAGQRQPVFTKNQKINDTFDLSYLFPASSEILFQQVHFKAVSRVFLLPIPVQAYHYNQWRNTQHNIGSPPSRFCFTWIHALPSIDDGLAQVVYRTAGPILCICWARHICCFDKGDQQKPKNPGLFNFCAHK